MPLGGVLPRTICAAKLARVARTLLWLAVLSLSVPRMLSRRLLLLWLQQAVARCDRVYLEHELASCRRDDVFTRVFGTVAMASFTQRGTTAEEGVVM